MDPGQLVDIKPEPDGPPDRDCKAVGAAANEKLAKRRIRVMDPAYPFAPAPLSAADEKAAKQKARRKAKRGRDPNRKRTLSDSPTPGPEPRRRKTFVASPFFFNGNSGGIQSYRQWFESATRYLRDNREILDTDFRKITALGSFLEGPAETWYKKRCDMFDRLRQEESLDSFVRAMHYRFKTTDEVDLAEMRVTKYDGDIYSYMAKLEFLNGEVEITGRPWREVVMRGLPAEISSRLTLRRKGPPPGDADFDDDDDDEDWNAVVIEHGLTYEKRRDDKAKLRDASLAPNAPPPKQPGAGPSRRRARGAATTVVKEEEGEGEGGQKMQEGRRGRVKVEQAS